MTERRDDEPRNESPREETTADEAMAEAAELPDGIDLEAVATPATPSESDTSPEALLRRERDELHDRWLRLLAEMDNLRKRTRREVDDARRFTAADLLRSLLEVQDNFDRALHATGQAAGSDDADASLAALRQGVELIAQSFKQVLQDRGVQEIAAEGQPFDPALHEALGQIPGPEAVETGTVLQVVQKGFTLDGLVLRPSRVILAQ